MPGTFTTGAKLGDFWEGGGKKGTPFLSKGGKNPKKGGRLRVGVPQAEGGWPNGKGYQTPFPEGGGLRAEKKKKTSAENPEGPKNLLGNPKKKETKSPGKAHPPPWGGGGC